MTAALIAIGALIFIYFAFIFPTQWVHVARIRVPLGLGKRIVQVSDLHVEKLRVSPERLRRLVEREKPDYLFLTGDYTERLRHVPKVEVYLRELLQLGVPMYAVFGNHDYRLKKDVAVLFELFERLQIPVLRNESVELDGFTLVGIDDLDFRLARPKEAFRGVGIGGDDAGGGDAAAGRRIVVIAHNPNVTLKIRHRYDYLMSGHFHGKQFRVPFLFYIKRKGPLPLQGIYKGLHRDGQGVFYISNGIGQANLNARFLIRSELTVHDL